MVTSFFNSRLFQFNYHPTTPSTPSTTPTRPPTPSSTSPPSSPSGTRRMPNKEFIDPKLYVKSPTAKQVEAEWSDNGVGALLVDSNLARKHMRKLKKLVRCGVPDGLRSLVWIELLDAHELYDRAHSYTSSLARVFGPTVPRNLRPPLFGGELEENYEFVALNEQGRECSKRLLCIIGHDFPNLEYCPFLPPVVTLLLHHLTPDQVLGTLEVLIQMSLKSGEWSYFPTYRRDINVFFSGFGDYLFKYNNKLYRHITSLQVKRIPIWTLWLRNFFISYLPLPTIFRIFDSFLHEGFKILYRFALAMILIRKDEIKACTSYAELLDVWSVKKMREQAIQNLETNNISQYDSSDEQSDAYIMMSEEEDSLAKESFDLSMRREDIQSARTARRLVAISDTADFPPESTIKDTPPSPCTTNSVRTRRPTRSLRRSHSMFHRPLPVLKLPNPKTETILGDTQWLGLWKEIPPRHKLLDLRLAFTTNENGRSLRTLFQSTQDYQPMILSVETTEGRKFGAFISKAWPQSEGPKRGMNRFGGTGETFLFSFDNEDSEAGESISIYRWVGANNPDAASQSAEPGTPAAWIRDMASFFVVASSDGIGVGGGGSGFGLWINSDLVVAHSATCSTFNNKPLAGLNTQCKNHEIAVLEVWVFT